MNDLKGEAKLDSQQRDWGIKKWTGKETNVLLKSFWCPTQITDQMG